MNQRRVRVPLESRRADNALEGRKKKKAQQVKTKKSVYRNQRAGSYGSPVLNQRSSVPNTSCVLRTWLSSRYLQEVLDLTLAITEHLRLK